MTTTLDFTEPLLTAHDELHLARRLEAGVLAAELQPGLDIRAEEIALLIDLGRDAWRRLWLSNLRLVNRIALQESRRLGVLVDDVFQGACIGLAEAIMRYDHTRGARFGTFAHPWIVRAAREAAADARPQGRLSVLGFTDETVDELPSQDATPERPWWLDALPRPERRVLVVRHLGERSRTLTETAHLLGLSQGQVRRLEASAFAIVRDLVRNAA